MRKAILILGFISLIFACRSTINENNTSLLENPWQYASSIIDSIRQPVFPDKNYVITDFGALGNGVFDCSEAIRTAIEKCNKEGGGKVIVPEGIFLTGAIHLKSKVNLYISEGATLLFSTDKSKYLPVVHTRFEGMECMNYSPFIYAFQQENIAITGKGTLNGQGESWWSWKGKWKGSIGEVWKNGMQEQSSDNQALYKMVEQNTPAEERVFGEGHFLRPDFIVTYDCKNVLIEGVKIISSPMWILHPILSENLTIRGLTIESLGPNNDGCDPESCKNILIEKCYFNTGDDCIAIKSGRNEDGRRFAKESKNIVIRNCTMVEGHGGVVIGSEISGNVSYIFAEDCYMDSPNLERAVRIKSNSLRGGIVEHLYVRNLEVKQVKEAILLIDMFYGNERGSNIPLVRNISLENIKSSKSEYGVFIKGCDEKPAINIYLTNCTFDDVKENNILSNVENIHFKNVLINGIKIKDGKNSAQ
jgi:polygalacturonase